MNKLLFFQVKLVSIRMRNLHRMNTFSWWGTNLCRNLHHHFACGCSFGVHSRITGKCKEVIQRHKEAEILDCYFLSEFLGKV